MALFHDLLFRGLNTIYLQVPFIMDIDKKNWSVMLIVGTTLSTVHCVTQFRCVISDEFSAHHTGEENEFFPWIEEAATGQGLMAADIEQHST